MRAGDLADSGIPAMARLPSRRAGRVVVLDPGDRVLLLRYDDDPWRWWTLAELDATAEVIWPAGLPGLIRGALRD